MIGWLHRIYARFYWNRKYRAKYGEYNFEDVLSASIDKYRSSMVDNIFKPNNLTGLKK